MAIKTQLVVIGAGPGGYPAAFRAADLGLEVTLIDHENNPGGVCLFRGCIPSKALLHVANIINDSEHAKELGITYTKPKVDIKKVVAWKNEVVTKLTGGAGFLAKQRKVKYIQGNAVFTDSKTIKITKEDGSEDSVSFENCVIATGSRPTEIPGIKVDNKKILNSRGALDLESVPKEFLVIGGGYIGLEMGTVYSALGSNVTVVEMLDSILATVDKDFSKILHKKLEKEFKSILLKTKVLEVKDTKKGVKVKFENSDGVFEHEYDKVLVSIGRKPNSENIGLENTKVKLDKGGFVEVDNRPAKKDK